MFLNLLRSAGGRSRRHRPSPALIVAIVALVVALGGTGYAALRLPASSVTARELASRSVGRSELKTASVNSVKVANGSLRASDFATRKLPAGPTGPTGPDGPPGTPGVTGLNAIAFAHINGSSPTGGNTVTETASSGITDADVTHPVAGAWCIRTTATPRVRVAMSVTDSPNPPRAMQAIDPAITGACPSGYQTEIFARDSTTGDFKDTIFEVVLY